jgi:hypothetical protein
MYDLVKQRLEQKQLSAKTFEECSRLGTPSAILVDKNGLVKHMIVVRTDFWRAQ